MPRDNHFANFVLFSYAAAKKLVDAYIDKIKLILFYQRFEVIHFFADSPLPIEKRPQVLVAIAHITSSEEAHDRQKAASKVERLQQTIDGLLTSLAHSDLQIIVYTVPQRQITHFLPQYQQERISVKEIADCDPMYIGFQAQDGLADRVRDFDWYIFIEDDIVISDSLFLEKVSSFCRYTPRHNMLLFPHRYEMYNGKKSYIDLTVAVKPSWDRVTSFEIGGVKFSECSNPHSGIYCLSQAQMKYWIKSGRRWKNRSLMVGPLESAATFCLQECFTIYKPHPHNLNYFEVKHFDTKYSKLYADPSPYILSAVEGKSDYRSYV